MTVEKMSIQLIGNNMNIKVCSKCKKNKYINNFHKNKTKKLE